MHVQCTQQPSELYICTTNTHNICAGNAWSLAEASQLSFDHKFPDPPLLCHSFISFSSCPSFLDSEVLKRQDVKIVWDLNFCHGEDLAKMSITTMVIMVGI